MTLEDVLYGMLHPFQTKDRETGEWREVVDPEPTPTQRYRYGDLIDRYGLSWGWGGTPHFPQDVPQSVWNEYYDRKKGITQPPNQWKQ